MLHAGQVQHSIRIHYSLGDMGNPSRNLNPPQKPNRNWNSQQIPGNRVEQEQEEKEKEEEEEEEVQKQKEAHKLKLSVCPWHMTCPAAGQR